LSSDDQESSSPTNSSAKSETRAKAGAFAFFQEQESIWNQVDRMKRMSILLKNAQLAHSIFLQEMMECLEDAAFTGAIEG
jgi:hypothetical protein